MAKYYDIDTSVRINGGLTLNGDMSIPSSNLTIGGNVTATNIIGNGSGITNLSSASMIDVFKLDGSRALTGNLTLNNKVIRLQTSGDANHVIHHTYYAINGSVIDGPRIAGHVGVEIGTIGTGPNTIATFKDSIINLNANTDIVGNITLTGTVDGVDVGLLKTSFDTLNTNYTNHLHDDRYYTETEINTQMSGKSDTGHVHSWTEITSKPLTFAPSTHSHNDLYYTETEINTQLSTKSDTSHVHSWTEIISKPLTFTPSVHSHDDLYYTETEIDTKLSTKSDTSHAHSWSQITSKPLTFAPSTHSHDDLYYTEAEINTQLGGKANTSHIHGATDITQTASYRFVSDTEKTTWNAKSNLAIGETSTTAYRGDRGKVAYDHSNQIEGAHSQVVNASVAVAGWHRVAQLSSSAGRGDVIFSLYTVGGSFTPQTTIIKYHGDWSSGSTLIVDALTGLSYWDKVRVVNDVGVYFVEVYFKRDLAFYIQKSATAGYDTVTTIFSGALAVGAGTVISEVALKVGINTTKDMSAEVFYENGLALSSKYAPVSHSHNDLYYTESEVNTLLVGKSDISHTHTFASLTSRPTTLAGYGITDASLGSHTHTFSSLTSKPTTLLGYGITDASLSTHLHDDRYYTEAEINSQMSGKSDTTHNHSTLYLGITAKASDADLLDGLSSNDFHREYTSVVPNINKDTFTTIAYVNGASLNSKIRLTLGGTAGSIVVSVIADIIVNHSADITVISQSGSYTGLLLRIISGSNEDFYIQVKLNTSSINTMDMETKIFPYGGEIVTIYTNNPTASGTTTHDHACRLGGVSLSSVGSVAEFDVNGNKVWHEGNDGSGSGLDADTLDGLQASSFSLVTHDHNTSYLGITAKASDSNLLDGLDSSQFIRSDTSGTVSGNLTLGSGVTNTARIVLDVSQAGSPQILLSDTGGDNRWSIGADDADNNFSIHGSTTLDTTINNIVNPHFEITTSGVLKASGSTIWHAGNDGAGSGLDADLLDGLNSTQFVRSDIDSSMNVNISSVKSISNTNKGLYLPFVDGGSFATDTSVMTGAITIELPVLWTNTMLRFAVDIYEYATGESFTAYIGGYNHTTGWINTSAHIIGGNTSRNFNIRFFSNGTKACVAIGEDNSTWSYPQIRVRDFTAGYSNYTASQWDDGWNISFTTLFGSIYETITDTLVKSSYSLDSAKLGGLTSSQFVRDDTSGQSVQGNFSIYGDGNLWVGTSANDGQDGDAMVRDNAGLNRIHLDGGSSGAITTDVNSLIQGNGFAKFNNRIEVNQLDIKASQGTAPIIVYSDTMVTKLNAEKLGGKKEEEFVKNASIYELGGKGVVDGLATVQQSVPNMTVLVQSGVVYTPSGRRFALGNTTVTIDASHATLARKDMIYVDGGSQGTEGTIRKITGTPATTPVDPSIPADAIPLARVNVRINDGSITDGTSATDDQIDDIIEWKAIIYDSTGNHLYTRKLVTNQISATYGNLEILSPLKNSNSNTSLTFTVGQTSQVWTHSNNAGVNYAVKLSCNSFEPHIRWTNKTTGGITIELDDVCEESVIVDVSIEYY